jgi:hypothetical protein
MAVSLTHLSDGVTPVMAGMGGGGRDRLLHGPLRRYLHRRKRADLIVVANIRW